MSSTLENILGTKAGPEKLVQKQHGLLSVGQ